MPSQQIAPHGGALVDLMATPERVRELKERSREMPSWALDARQAADVEALLCGAFSPLTGFMARKDYESVLSQMRLANGTFWPVPVVLEVGEELAKGLAPGSGLALRDAEGVMLAVLNVEEVWRPDRQAEAEKLRDPGQTAQAARETASFYVGGRIEGIEAPRHYDFVDLRVTPAQLRERFSALGWRNVAAFNADAAMHRAEHELTLAACRKLEANLLIHAPVGYSHPSDAGHYSRIRCLQAVARMYPSNTAKLRLAPLGPRCGGAREVLWNALVRQNYGCSHYIVRAGQTSHDALARHGGSLEIKLTPAPEMAYVADAGGYVGEDQAPKGSAPLKLSEPELKERLDLGREIPQWFSFPEVVREL